MGSEVDLGVTPVALANKPVMGVYFDEKICSQILLANPSLDAKKALDVTCYADRTEAKNKNLVLSNELIKVELPPWKI